MSLDLDAISRAVAREGRVVRVVVAEARGSAPREPGAAMLVWRDGQEGTIGGGALEHEATARARAMLSGPCGASPAALRTGTAAVERRALGPDLQQCCGGAVTLVFEPFGPGAPARPSGEAGLVARRITGAAEMPLAVRRRLQAARSGALAVGTALVEGWLVEPLARPRRRIWVWGAGHVGRAIVAVLAPLPDLAVTWADTDASRFPESLPEGVERVVAADPAALAAFAPREAEHLILTYSHAIDLALCHALLTRGFARCGLIGSRTKWARFRRRLAELGHPPGAVLRIDCPIGDPSLGKHPQAIAISVAASILSDRRAERSAKDGAG